jgi:hypothetical protein
LASIFFGSKRCSNSLTHFMLEMVSNGRFSGHPEATEFSIILKQSSRLQCLNLKFSLAKEHQKSSERARNPAIFLILVLR